MAGEPFINPFVVGSWMVMPHISETEISRHGGLLLYNNHTRFRTLAGRYDTTVMTTQRFRKWSIPATPLKAKSARTAPWMRTNLNMSPHLC